MLLPYGIIELTAAPRNDNTVLVFRKALFTS